MVESAGKSHGIETNIKRANLYPCTDIFAKPHKHKE